MATIEFKGIDVYSKKLSKIGRDGVAICKMAVYEGADEVANAIRKSTERLPTISDVKAVAKWKKNEKIDCPTEKQKAGLVKGLNISPMKDDMGYIYTRVSFVGYNDVRTKAYPKGEPNAMIARSIESGSSARSSIPFVRPAIRSCKSVAVARMAKKVEELIYNIMEGD